MHYQNDLLSLVDPGLDASTHDRGIVEKVLIRRLGTDRGIGHALGLPSLRVQLVLGELEAIRRMPRAGGKYNDGLFRRGHGREV